MKRFDEKGRNVGNPRYPTWPLSGALESTYLNEVLNSGKWGGSGGSNLKDYQHKIPEFEDKFARFQDADHGVTVVNGTLAITVALQAAGVKPFDEVIMPPYTFIATATSALLFGAIPVFVDVEEESLLIDPEKVEQAITSKTKAIVAVHIGGTPANLDRLMGIAEQYNLVLIEDAAQAVGAQWKGQGVGAIGDLGTFSFQSSKNLTSGEGGIILTNNKRLADKAWSLANVGRVRDGSWYQHDEIGWNLRITEFQAAILLGQMSRLEDQIELRNRNAKLLTELLSPVEGIQLFKTDPRVTRNGYHLFMFYLEKALSERVNKSQFVKMLSEQGIPSSTGYTAINKYDSITRSIQEWTGKEPEFHCPIAEQMGDRQAIWITQTVLLGDEKGIVYAAEAIKNVVQSHL